MNERCACVAPQMAQTTRNQRKRCGFVRMGYGLTDAPLAARKCLHALRLALCSLQSGWADLNCRPSDPQANPSGFANGGGAVWLRHRRISRAARLLRRGGAE